MLGDGGGVARIHDVGSSGLRSSTIILAKLAAVMSRHTAENLARLGKISTCNPGLLCLVDVDVMSSAQLKP